MPDSATDTKAHDLQLARFLPYRLSVLSNTISSAIAGIYQREFDLTVWQWRVMAVLAEAPGLTSREVAARTAMDKVAVSRAVSGLIAAGRLARHSDERDARAARLQLTKAGLSVYAQIAPRARAFEGELLAGLSREEAAHFNALLAKLAKSAAPDRPLW